MGLNRKRGVYMHVASHFRTRVNIAWMFSLFLSVITALLGSLRTILDNSADAEGGRYIFENYNGIVVLLSAINALVLFGVHLTTYQSHVDSAESAAAQYDALLTRVDYACKYRIGAKRSMVNSLLAESERGMSDIAQHSLVVPQ